MRVLVTGAGGQLGRDLVDALGGSVPPGGLTGDPATGRLGQGAAREVLGLDHGKLDVADRLAVAGAVEAFRPDVVVHSAAWTAVDACEGDPDRAFAVNASGTRHVVEASRRVGAHVLYVSTDYVFDGTSARPYVEWDPTNPLSVYGRSKLGGELELGPQDCIVRTSWVCGARGANMVRTIVRLAAGEGPMAFVDDQHGCPTFTADLAGALSMLAADRRVGVFHVTNSGPTTWFEFARAVLAGIGQDPDRVGPIATAELSPPRPAPRPANSVLDNAAMRHGGMAPMPPWEDALARLLHSVTGLHGSPSAWAVPR
jgi:dTDP-4-dehydrorhamnose reductase